jgi:predicted 2-oxoglutarate/Fe(II)-dependent dioxygenase YbiX
MPTLTKNVSVNLAPKPASGTIPAAAAAAVQPAGPLALDSHHLRQYVVVLENVLSADFCDQLMAEFATSDEWKFARVGGQAEVDRDTRNVDVIELSQRSILQKNATVREVFEQTLYGAGLKAVRHYQALFPFCRIVEGRGFELLRYHTGGFYRTHTDSFKRVPRSLSCSFALNDNFGGGDWSLFCGDYTLRPPKGSAVLFPSNFMFPHEILEVTSGTRYAVVTWMI